MPTKSFNRPSSLQRRSLCPGSGRMESAFPPGPSSEFAEQGTRLHEAVTNYLEKKIPIPKMEEEELEWVMMCVNEVEKLREHFLTPEATEVYEYDVELGGLGMPGRSGKVDYAMIFPGHRMLIIDYKFGTVYVDSPEYNWQSKCYGLALLEKFGGRTLELTIIQPRMNENIQIRSCSIENEDLDKARNGLSDLIERTEMKDAALIPGAKQCQFCNAKESCPALQKTAQEIIPVGTDLTVHLNSLTPLDRKVLYEKLLIAKSWVGEIVAKIEVQSLYHGMQISGYEQGTKRGKREWIDPDRAHIALKQLCIKKGKNANDLIQTLLLTPPEAEKLVGKAKDAREVMELLVTKKPGGPKLIKAWGK